MFIKFTCPDESQGLVNVECVVGVTESEGKVYLTFMDDEQQEVVEPFSYFVEKLAL